MNLANLNAYFFTHANLAELIGIMLVMVGLSIGLIIYMFKGPMKDGVAISVGLITGVLTKYIGILDGMILWVSLYFLVLTLLGKLDNLKQSQ